jgi:hypothetical protein
MLEGLTDRCHQVMACLPTARRRQVGCAGRQPSVFRRAAHGEMVKSFEGVVREACLHAPHKQAHQFMHGIVEETADAGRSYAPGSRLAEASGVARVGFESRRSARSPRFPKIDGDSDRERFPASGKGVG